MGIGQSKFGRGNKNAQYPYGFQPYSQYAATQPPFMPPYAAPGGFLPPGQHMFPPQMQQYGVIPPEFYGQAARNRPPRMMGWLPQDKPVKKKRKSRRTHSENFVGGFAGEAPSETRPRRAHSESHNRPDPDGPSMPVPEIQRSTTAHSSRARDRRASTPFIPPNHRRDNRDEDEDDRPRALRNSDINRHHPRRRSPIRYDTPEPIDDDIQRVLRPMPSAESVVYGPKGERPRRRLTNPLPEPPRDIYEMTPYKALASLPRTSAALLATSYGPRQHVYDTENPTVKRNKSVKGILRAFSRKEKKDPVVVVPIFKNGSQVQFQSQLIQPQMQMPQPQGQQPQLQPQFPQGPVQQSQLTQAQMQMPQGPATVPDIPLMQQSQLTQPQMQMPQPGQSQPDIPQMQQSQLTQPQMQMPQGPGNASDIPAMQQSQLTQPHMQMPQPNPDTLHRSGSWSNRKYGGPNTPGPNYLQPQNIQFPQPGGGASHFGSSPMHSHSSPDAIPPIPPVPSNPPPIRFDQTSPLNGFLSHSQYRVLYRNQTYPTALHLHEAMKFIDTKPDIADMIRRLPDIHSVYPLAQQYQEYMRNDWQHKCVEFMEEVVFLKTKQHPDLRALLMNTGYADIEYIDPNDGFWGTGPSGNGKNHLGKIMARVRERSRLY